MLDRAWKQREALFGRGFYGATESVRLINFHRREVGSQKVGPQTIRRWIEGYAAGGKSFPPLWRADYQNRDHQLELSFRDVIELRFVKAFRDAGVSLQTIRACVERAKNQIDDARPFSTLKFRTDGRTIFQLITSDVNEGEMTDLRTRQNVFRTMIEPSLKDLEFDGDELKRWRPLGQSSKVAVDPAKAFGRPIVLGHGVTTEALASAVPVEGSQQAVARLYEVPLSVVRDAVTMQERLAA
jgi:uncharacterized protein (DUF433 family)/DNA-binding transcriptional MerR regulator